MIDAMSALLLASQHGTGPAYADGYDNSPASQSRIVMAGSMSTSPRFQHRPLEDAHDHIRVLEIEPADILDAPLRCRIRHISIRNSMFRYRTLSYTWGQPCFTGVTHIRYEDDDHFRSFSITESLEMGLRRVRARQVKRVGARQAADENDPTCEGVPLWVDAICINQNNDEEKGSQVGIMADIYSNAAGLIIWLGNLEPFQYHRGLRELVRRSPTKLGRIIAMTSGTSSIAALLNATWFERRWCVQEFLKSATENTCVLFGAQTMSCNDLTTLLLQTGLLGRAGVLQTSRKDETVSLLENLQRFSHYKCGNDLDLVFSLLSISDYQPLDARILTPDYTMYTSRLFQQVAARYCTTDSLVPLLQCASVRKGDTSRRSSLDDSFLDWMPSWVPDWRRPTAYESEKHEEAVNRPGIHFCRPSKTCCDRSCSSTVDGENISRTSHDGCCQQRISSPPDEYGITIVGSTLVLKHYLILSCDAPTSEQHVETCPYHRFHQAQTYVRNSSLTLSLAEQPLLRSDEAMLIFQQKGKRMVHGRKPWCTLHNRIEKRSSPVDDDVTDPCRRFWLEEAPKYHGIGFILRTAHGGRAKADSAFQLHSCFRCPDFTLDEFPLSRTEVRIT